MAFRFAVPALLAALAPSLPALAQTAGAPAETVVVLDASGSMWGRVDGRPKIEIAREATRALFESFPAQARIGLLAYGHRRAGDCRDIETLVPIGARDAPRLQSAAAALTPRGKTPLTEAVRAAARLLDSDRRGGTIILVTDGIETCEADPCALAAELHARNAAFTVHVVGFDLRSPTERARVACIAERTGGTFTAAGNAAELATALEGARAAAPQRAVQARRIALVATDGEGGAPLPTASFAVTRIEDESVIAEDAGGDIALPPGRYRVAATSGARAGAVEAVVDARAPQRIIVPLTATLPSASVAPPGPTAMALSTIDVAWEGPNEEGDYLVFAALAGTEQPETRHYAHTRDGAPARLRVPTAEGRYEVRYIRAEGLAVLARAPVSVTAANVTMAAPGTGVAGATIEVAWTGPVGPMLWIGFVAQGGAPTAYVPGAWASVVDGNPLPLRLPAAPGAYDLRYVDDGDGVVLASRPFVVTPAEARVAGPAEVRAGWPVAVRWQGPAGAGDWIGIEPVGAEPDAYTSGQWTDPVDDAVTLRAPLTPGMHEMRYVQAAPGGRRVLATAPLRVVAADVLLDAPERVQRGAAIAVRHAGPGIGGDFIALARPGDDPSAYALGYVDADTPEGTRSLTAPAEAGRYELRYVTGRLQQVIGRREIIVE